MKFEEKVWKICKKIPKGKVSTYKEIAKALDTKAYRAVGQALSRNPYAPTVPCHRVVCSDGRVGGYQGKKSSQKKIEMLKKEGVLVSKGKIKHFKALFSKL
ncbi:MGMT family protein [Candidatus Woesearchaeota archaeon]|nr:MGMT family protein [Candidatus Woesearchaeota archaeon]